MTEIPNPFWLQEISLLLRKELIKPSFLQAFSPGAPHPSAAQHAFCLFKSWFLVPLSSATWSLHSAMKHSSPLSEGSLLPMKFSRSGAAHFHVYHSPLTSTFNAFVNHWVFFIFICSFTKHLLGIYQGLRKP